MEKTIKRFMKFEKDNDLINKQIDDIYFWVIIRKRIINQILIDLGLISKSHFTIGNNKYQQIKYVFSYLFNAFINLFKKIPKVEEVIINHPRKVLYDGQYMDIYTYYIQEEYKKNNIKFLTIDVPYNWHKHLIRKEPYIRNMENFSIIPKIYYKFFNRNKFKNNKMLNDISKKLIKEFKTDGNLINTVSSQIYSYKSDYKYYKKFLTKCCPKTISIVISEVYPGIVQAARDLNILTVEIQHAAISKQHLAYEYPYNKNIPYFPDKIRMFGNFWYDSTDIPISKENVILTENKFLIDKSKEKIEKKSNQVLFVAQGWITKKMITYIKEFYGRTDKYNLVLKLHPSEFEIWKKEYPELLELEKKYPLVIIDNFEKSIYDWLKESEHVVGVSSTCLYEALLFNCKVHLLNLPSVESMKALVERKIASISNNGKELVENIKDNKNDNKIDLNYIYYKNDNSVPVCK